MFTEVRALFNNTYLVTCSARSGSITSSFLRGRWVFDTTVGTLTIGKNPPISFTDKVSPDTSLRFILANEKNEPGTQERTGFVKPETVKGEQVGGRFYFAGSKTAPLNARDDGWGNVVYKFRAYLQHPGVETDNALPQWIKDSIERQRRFWNRLAWLCKQARQACDSADPAGVLAFVRNTVLPGIIDFNHSLKDTKHAIAFPPALNNDNPSVQALWNFYFETRRLTKHPVELLETIRTFLDGVKIDYTPIQVFQKNVAAIAANERVLQVKNGDVWERPTDPKATVANSLRNWEMQPVLRSFQATLKRRQSTKARFFEGWPKPQPFESSEKRPWGIHYYLNQPNVDASNLATGSGIRGLSLGEPLAPALTGHPDMHGRQAKRRQLRPATISLRDRESGETWALRFAVLVNRSFPEGANIKEWKFIYKDGAYWLCLTMEIKFPKLAEHHERVAALHLGWRRTDDGVKLATLYMPEEARFTDLTLHFTTSPVDTSKRKPFAVMMGPSRWGRRNRELRGGFFDVFEQTTLLQKERDDSKDALKAYLQEHLVDSPAWLPKAGIQGLRKLAAEAARPEIREAIALWEAKDAERGRDYAFLWQKLSGRLKKGYEMLAHDILRNLLKQGYTRLAIEKTYLKQMTENLDNFAPDAVKNSQKYRQWAAPATLVQIVKNTAVKYGIDVVQVPGSHISIQHVECGSVNKKSAQLNIECTCGAIYNQDHNAAKNLVAIALASSTN